MGSCRASGGSRSSMTAADRADRSRAVRGARSGTRSAAARSPSPAGTLSIHQLRRVRRRGRACDGRGGLGDGAHRRQLLGGYVSLQLAARGRAHTVVALAPAGGWAQGEGSYKERSASSRLAQPREDNRAARRSAPGRPQGPAPRKRNTSSRITSTSRPLLVHQMLGVASCTAALPLIDNALRQGWSLDAEKITRPMRILWGTTTSCCHGRLPPRDCATSGCPTPTGSSLRASATAHSSIPFSRPHS
jgi:hypothetical protein